MKKTPIQQFIEYSVTNGVGYEPSYQPKNHTPLMFEEKLSSKKIHDSWEGLEAYLFSLSGVRQLVNERKAIGKIYGASNQEIALYPVTTKDLKQFSKQERKLMTEAYLAERERQGGFKQLLFMSVAERMIGFEITKNVNSLLAASENQ